MLLTQFGMISYASENEKWSQCLSMRVYWFYMTEVWCHFKRNEQLLGVNPMRTGSVYTNLIKILILFIKRMKGVVSCNLLLQAIKYDLLRSSRDEQTIHGFKPHIFRCFSTRDFFAL